MIRAGVGSASLAALTMIGASLAILLGGAGGASEHPAAALLTSLVGPDAAPLPRLDPAARHLRQFEARLQRAPLSANGHVMLAALLSRHVKESGNETPLARVETLLRRALELRPDYPEATEALADSLNTQHWFAAAAVLAESELGGAEPRPGLLSALFDARLGIGDCQGAAAVLADLVAAAQRGPAVLARKARLLELHGQTAAAFELLVSAAAQARDGYMSRGQVAWYLYRLGDLLGHQGQHREALVYADAALELAPAGLPARLVRARSLAALGRTAEAVVAYEDAVLQAPHPEIVGALGSL